MAIANVSVGRSAAERLASRPALGITRPMTPGERGELWERYVALVRKSKRNAKDEDEVFKIQQRLGIPDVEHELAPHILAAEEALAGADEKADSAKVQLDAAHEARQALQREQHAAVVKMRAEMEAAKTRCQVAEGRHSTATFRAQQLAGLKARFFRLFGGDRPGADCVLPADVANELHARGLDARTMAACR